MRVIFRFFCATFLLVTTICGANGPDLIEMFRSKDKQPSLSEVRAAIEQKADVNAIAEGKTVMMLAAANVQDPNIILELYNAGASINHLRYFPISRLRDHPQSVEDPGFSVLIEAAKQNSNPEIIEMLIRMGAAVDAGSYNGATALMFAANDNPKVEVIEALLRAGADVNAKAEFGHTAFIYARHNPNPEIIQVLARNGAKVNEVDRYGISAISAAIEEEEPRPEILEAYMKSGVTAYFDIIEKAVVAAKKLKKPEIATVVVKWSYADIAAQKHALVIAKLINADKELVAALSAVVDGSKRRTQDSVQKSLNVSNSSSPDQKQESAFDLVKICLVLITVLLTLLCAMLRVTKVLPPANSEHERLDSIKKASDD